MTETLTDLAETTLREQIFSGRMLPGTRFTEAGLAAHLGLSRTPVREAAMRLQTAGLVTVRPRHGITIASISVEDMAHIYEVLTALEIVAVGRVAARHPHAFGELAQLQRAVGNMRYALSVRDMGTWASADEDFHRALVELSATLSWSRSLIAIPTGCVARAWPRCIIGPCLRPHLTVTRRF